MKHTHTKLLIVINPKDGIGYGDVPKQDNCVTM